MKNGEDSKYISFPKYVTPPGSPKGYSRPMLYFQHLLPGEEEPPTSPPRMSPVDTEQIHKQGPSSMATLARKIPSSKIQTTHSSIDTSLHVKLCPKTEHKMSISGLPPNEIAILQQKTSAQTQIYYHTPIENNTLFSGKSNTTASHHLPQNSLMLLSQLMPTSHHLSLPHPSPKCTFSMRTPVPSHKEVPIIQESIPQSDNLPLHSASASGPSCTICGDRAGQHLHYGAVACFSYRQFSRRGRPKGNRCVNDTGCCNINKFNRTNCKLCR